jgi:hypothetical protein
MERPTVAKKYADLAPYGSAKLSAASAAGCTGSGLYYSGDSKHRNVQVAMVNNALPIPDILSSVAPADGISMNFGWKKFH